MDYHAMGAEGVMKLQTENSIFNGKDAGHYKKWTDEIKEYLKDRDFEYNEDFIIKLALSQLLQSLRNGEDTKRFQWRHTQ